jgi:hypothetical protein
MLKKQFKWAEIATRIGSLPSIDPPAPKRNTKTGKKGRRRYRRRSRREWSSEEEDLSGSESYASGPEKQGKEERPPARRSAANVRILAREAAALLEDEDKESADESWKEEPQSDHDNLSSKAKKSEKEPASGPGSSDTAPELKNSLLSESALATELPAAPASIEMASSSESRAAYSKAFVQSDLDVEVKNSPPSPTSERLITASLLLASASEAVDAPSAGPESQVRDKEPPASAGEAGTQPSPKLTSAKILSPRKRAATGPALKTRPQKTTRAVEVALSEVPERPQEKHVAPVAFAVSAGLQYQQENERPTSRGWVAAGPQDAVGAPSAKRVKVVDSSAKFETSPRKTLPKPLSMKPSAGVTKSPAKKRTFQGKAEVELNLFNNGRFLERHQMLAKAPAAADGPLCYDGSLLSHAVHHEVADPQLRARVMSSELEPHGYNIHPAQQSHFASYGQPWPRPDQVMQSHQAYGVYRNSSDDLSPGGSSGSYGPEDEYGIGDDYTVSLANYADWDTAYSTAF